MDEVLQEKMAVLALSFTPDAGRVAVNRTIDAAHRAKAYLPDLLAQPAPRLIGDYRIGDADAVELLARCGEREVMRAERLVRRANEQAIRMVARQDDDYPDMLTACLGLYTPPLLFMRGNPGLLGKPCGGIAGARKASLDAIEVARRCAVFFAQQHAPVVSGGAKGVDSAAHAAVLKAGGDTVVVLPEGLMTYEPPTYLEAGLRENRALIISEFAPDEEWQTHQAVTRNATLSALSRMVCVIEPKRKGGSIRTAECANEQGKCVLVFPHEDGGLSPLAMAQRIDNTAALEATLASAWRETTEPATGQASLF